MFTVQKLNEKQYIVKYNGTTIGMVRVNFANIMVYKQTTEIEFPNSISWFEDAIKIPPGQHIMTFLQELYSDNNIRNN